jgi:formylglycine-generating enzyme required for sulfatase activity
VSWLPLLLLLAHAVAAAVTPPQRGPLTSAEVVFLLQSGVAPARVGALIERHGIDFAVSERILDLVREAGGDESLEEVLRRVAPAEKPKIRASPKPARATPAATLVEPDMVQIPGGPRGVFYLGRYEVTNRQYLAFCERMGRPQPAAPFWGRPDRYPVVNVTWHDAVTFCRWLALTTGRNYRLPSTAEWEHAARGGSRLPQAYPWGDEDPLGRSCFGKGLLCPVGSFKANGYGIHDLAGSAAEWCEDGDAGGTRRFVKGGSWASPLVSPEALSITRRELVDADKARNQIGFRLARDR